MFLSNFSIKQPVTTVAIVIVLMCLGLLALKNLRVNQIPGRREPGDVGQLPVSGRVAGDGGARDHQSRREIAAEHSAGLRDLRRPRRRATPTSPSSSTSRRTCRRPATRSATRSPRCATSCRIEMREPVLCRRDPTADPIMNLGLSSTKQSHAEISRLAEDVLADQLRGIDGVVGGRRRRLAASRAVGAAARAEAARVQRVGGRRRERAARAEHQRAGGPRQGRDGRAEHPARGPHRVARPSSTTSS